MASFERDGWAIPFAKEKEEEKKLHAGGFRYPRIYPSPDNAYAVLALGSEEKAFGQEMETFLVLKNPADPEFYFTNTPFDVYADIPFLFSKDSRYLFSLTIMGKAPDKKWADIKQPEFAVLILDLQQKAMAFHPLTFCLGQFSEIGPVLFRIRSDSDTADISLTEKKWFTSRTDFDSVRSAYWQHRSEIT